MEPQRWLWPCLLVFPFACYLGLRRVSRACRGVVAGVGCMLLTGAIGESLPMGQLWAIVACSFCWLLSARLVSLVLRPDFASLPLWNYSQEFLWLILPLKRLEPRLSAKQVFVHCTTCLLHAGFKFVLAHVTRHWLVFCMHRDLGPVGGARLKQESTWLVMQYSALLFVYIVAGTFQNDLQQALVMVLTWGRYSLVPFSENVHLSRSPRQFWGRRYNRLFYTVAHAAVFSPLYGNGRGPLSKGAAAMAVFLYSGLLHAHVGYICFARP